MRNNMKRESIRALENGYYHLSTDGLSGGNIFNNVAQYTFGMILMGLITIRFSLKVYVFCLMPNHIHIILSGTGSNCLLAFDYLKRKLSARLKKDGYTPLPDDYWFKLTPITTPEQMRSEILYVLRNPLEKGLAMVGGYLWSSEWLYYTEFTDLMSTIASTKISKRELKKVLMGEDSIPEEWRIHPYLGLHPSCFVDKSLVLKLFPSPKDLQAALVKDYETYFQIASRLGEVCEFSKTERDSIVEQTLQKRFHGRSLNALTEEDRAKLAIILNREFGFDSYQISTTVFIKERTVRQLLSSKELR